MDHRRLRQLSAIVLKEAKALLTTGDRSDLVLTDPVLTDPVLESGKRMAQSFSDSQAGDADYEVWIRLLRLHSSARNFVDGGEEAAAGLNQEITELERLLSPDASIDDRSERESVSVAVHTD